MKRTLVFWIIVVLAVASVAAAQEGPVSWEDFLRWIAAPSGIVVAIGIGKSFLTEYTGKWFHDLAPRWKQLIFLGISLVVPVVAAALGVYTVGWPGAWEPTYWNAVQAGVMGFTSGTILHNWLPRQS